VPHKTGDHFVIDRKRLTDGRSAYLPLLIDSSPDPADVRTLRERINAYNNDCTNAYDYLPLASFIRDENGTIIAGLSGATWAGICEIELLWVHKDLRWQGYGARLLAAAEAEASKRGCNVILLSTFSFQAPGFYLRHGYEMAGIIPDYPSGYTNYIFVKRSP
jgi:GNAT superfamily N-acetyltransferase